MNEAESPIWIVEPGFDIAPRSKLIGLRPFGLGTAYRESLSSYFLRLADAHCLAPHVVAQEILFPDRSRDSEGRTIRTQDDWRETFFSGMGQLPQTWIATLEDATGVRGLESLTLAFLSGLVTKRGLQHPLPRWCPVCLREGDSAGSPYGQLLWTFQAVTCCPKHGVRLVAKCGCGADEFRSRGTVKALPHVCIRCGRHLGGVEPPGLDRATAEELRRARMVADLLAGDLATDGRRSTRGTPQFLADSITRHFEGVAARFAHHMGIGRSTLHGWVHGMNIPEFGQIVAIAEAHGCSIEDVLCGRTEAVVRSPHIPGSLRDKDASVRRREARDWEEVGERLAALLQEEPALNMVEIGKRLGIRHDVLRVKHPDICAALSARWLASRTARVAKKKAEVEDRVRELAQGMAAMGIQPTWRRIVAAGLPAEANWRWTKACQAICRQVWRESSMRNLQDL